MTSMKLSTKISIWILLIILALGFVFNAAIVRFQRKTSTRDFKEFSTVIAKTIGDGLRADMLENRRDHIQYTLESLDKRPSINSVAIFSWDNTVAFSGKKDEIGQKTNDKEISEVLKTGKSKQRISRKYGIEEYSVVIPVKNQKACHSCHAADPSSLGAIEVGLDTKPLTEHLEIDSRSATILAVIESLAILLSVLIILHRTILKRLSLISKYIRKFAAGDYEGRISIKSHDELGELAETFNTMSDQVQETIGKLEEADEQLDRSLLRFGKLFGTDLDLDMVPDLIVNELADNNDVSQVTFFLCGGSNRLMLVSAKEVSQGAIKEYNSQPDVCDERSPRFTALWNLKHLFINESLTINNSSAKGLFAKIASLHQKKDFYIFSLQGSKRLFGLVVIVPSPGQQLDRQKIKMVQLICQETATAIENFIAHKILKKASITDELTQLFNQRHFFDTLKEETERAKRYGTAFSLLFLDLDRFKSFNDSFGHRVGDGVLRQVSCIILQQVRVSDRVFRYGGDEFALILPETNRDEAVNLARRILAEIKETNFIPRGREASFKLSGSVGVVSYDGSKAYKEEEIFKAADDALHKAKDAGRDRIAIG